MGVDIIDGGDYGAAMYCTTEQRAFGPLFGDVEEAREFLDTIDEDPRTLQNEGDLADRYNDWNHD